MSVNLNIDIDELREAEARGHIVENIFQENLWPSKIRSLKIHFIEAMMKGREDQNRFDVAFMNGKEVVLRAEIVMGASSFDLQSFAVAELKKRYKRSRVGRAMLKADKIVINGMTYTAEKFPEAPEFWQNKRSVDPRYAFTQSIAVRDWCMKNLRKASKGMDKNSNEFKALARQLILPYHVAYLYWSFKCNAFDGGGRSLDRLSRVLDFFTPAL